MQISLPLPPWTLSWPINIYGYIFSTPSAAACCTSSNKLALTGRGRGGEGETKDHRPAISDHCPVGGTMWYQCGHVAWPWSAAALANWTPSVSFLGGILGPTGQSMLVKCLPPKRTERFGTNKMCRLLPVACCKLPALPAGGHSIPSPRPNPRERRERHLNGVIIFAPSPGSFGSELIACHIINFRLPPLLKKRLLYTGPGAGLGPTLTCGILTRRNSSEKFQKSCGMLQSCWVLLSPDVWACQGVVA